MYILYNLGSAQTVNQLIPVVFAHDLRDLFLSSVLKHFGCIIPCNLDAALKELKVLKAAAIDSLNHAALELGRLNKSWHPPPQKKC